MTRQLKYFKILSKVFHIKVVDVLDVEFVDNITIIPHPYKDLNGNTKDTSYVPPLISE
jgi:pentose-5-phosphate-3-epimerase